MHVWLTYPVVRDIVLALTETCGDSEQLKSIVTVQEEVCDSCVARNDITHQTDA